MTTLGVDYSWSRPGGAALAAAGKTFACRYLEWSHAPASSQGAFLTTAEVADLHNHGIAIVANFESATTRALTARATGGTTDGTDARVAMSALGFPVGRTVYASVDTGTIAGQYPAIATYLKAFQAALAGKYRMGLYGGSTLWTWLIGHGFAGVPLWQAAALSWSGGKWSPQAAVQQYLNGQSLNGASVDFDRALVADFGQWAAPQLPETDTEVNVPIYSLGGMRTGQVAAGTPYYTNPGDSAPRAKIGATARFLLTAFDATGKWVALDGGYAGPTGTSPVMCGWVPLTAVTAIEPAVPVESEWEVTTTFHAVGAPTTTTTKA